jgi:uncharacterized protein YqiB (DUF1249 family)
VIAFLEVQALDEISDARWRRLGRTYLPQRFSESLTVISTMSRAAKLTISEQPKWTDLFTAEQTAQTCLATFLELPQISIASYRQKMTHLMSLNFP